MVRLVSPHQGRKAAVAKQALTRDLVLAGVIEILCDHMGKDSEKVTETSVISDDLGADSLDFVEILCQWEDEFDVNIPDEVADRFVTVRDAVNFIWQQVQNSIEDERRPR